MSRIPSLILTLAAALLVVPARAPAQEPGPGPSCAIPDTLLVSGATRIPMSVVRTDAGYKVGDTLNYRVVQRYIKKLFATGNYDDIQIHCDVNAQTGRSALLVRLIERPLLAGFSVAGNSKVSQGTIKQNIELPVGRPVDPARSCRAPSRASIRSTARRGTSWRRSGSTPRSPTRTCASPS